MRKISKVRQQTQAHGTAQVKCSINDVHVLGHQSCACHFVPMIQIIIRCIYLDRDRGREREIQRAREGGNERGSERVCGQER